MCELVVISLPKCHWGVCTYTKNILRLLQVLQLCWSLLLWKSCCPHGCNLFCDPLMQLPQGDTGVSKHLKGNCSAKLIVLPVLILFIDSSAWAYCSFTDGLILLSHHLILQWDLRWCAGCVLDTIFFPHLYLSFLVKPLGRGMRST